MIKNNITIINKLGLHARAAAKLVNTASAYSSSIQIGTEQRMINAKSIMSVMLLAASKGTLLKLEIKGADEFLAMTAIQAVINNKFGEDE